MYRIALDMMGGDLAPFATLEGAYAALTKYEDLYLFMVGDEAVLQPMLAKYGLKGPIMDRCELVHAPEVVTMDDKATCILKEKKSSSIRVAAQLVREGRADGIVSMGHTGAAMVASKMVVGTLPGVDRPCLAAVLPNIKGLRTVLLDVGANVDSKPEHIAQFALMGAVYAEEVLGIMSPRVGVLSVGEEDGKGTEITRSAFSLLKELDLNFVGNAEGRDIWNGRFDVIACDGFVGNSLLKSSEALAEGLVHSMKESIMEGLFSRLGGALIKPAMKRVMKKLDYSEAGGAPLLGVKGISIIGHGRSDGKTVGNAIQAALVACEHRINDRIHDSLERLLPQATTSEP